jgi:hypothetical protein
MFLLNGEPLAIDTPFTADDIQYPANWLRLSTLEEKEAIGITEVPDPEPYDQRFYWGPGLPKDHAQLVEQWVAQTRTTAGTLLAPTDWIIIREIDNGTAADPVLKTWREDIRVAVGVKVSAINNTVDTDALATYITSTEYPVWPINPNSVVSAVKEK